MVKLRTIIILAVLAAVSTGLAVWSWRVSHARLDVAGVGEPLIAGLAQKGKDAARIDIILDDGKDRITLVRKGGKWFAGKAGYPADVEKIRKFLVALVGMRKAEPKTRRKENYGLLRLDEPGREGAKGTRVIIRDDKGAVIADVILGKPVYDRLGAGKRSQYARLTGEAQSWLVEGQARPVPALTRWVNHIAVDIPRDKVTAGKIVHADGEVLEVYATGKKGTDGEPIFAIRDKPQGAKEKPNYQIASVARDLAQLDFELARKAKAHKDKPIVHAEVTGAGGLVVGYDVYREGKALWVAVKVIKAGKDKALAERIEKTTAGWEYGLSESSGSYFLKRLKDVIEVEEDHAAKPPAPDGVSAGAGKP